MRDANVMMPTLKALKALPARLRNNLSSLQTRGSVEALVPPDHLHDFGAAQHLVAVLSRPTLPTHVDDALTSEVGKTVLEEIPADDLTGPDEKRQAEVQVGERRCGCQIGGGMHEERSLRLSPGQMGAHRLKRRARGRNAWRPRQVMVAKNRQVVVLELLVVTGSLMCWLVNTLVGAEVDEVLGVERRNLALRQQVRNGPEPDKDTTRKPTV